MHVRHVEERPGKATGHEIMSLPQPQQQHASTNNYVCWPVAVLLLPSAGGLRTAGPPLPVVPWSTAGPPLPVEPWCSAGRLAAIACRSKVRGGIRKIKVTGPDHQGAAKGKGEIQRL